MLNILNIKKIVIIAYLCLFSNIYFTQFNFDKQLEDNQSYSEDIVDEIYGITIYESLNLGLSADSVRMENGYAVNNWKEDFYKSGQLLHKGYYIDGQLKIYKNYYPNGSIERDFKNIDGFRSKVILYYPNGNQKSEVSYLSGSAILWIDYYENGNMEFYEEFYKNILYHKEKKDFYESGQEQSALVNTNKKKLTYSYNEYYSDGINKIVGTMKYDMDYYDYYKTGTWVYYDSSGKETKHETYSDGKVVKTKKY